MISRQACPHPVCVKTHTHAGGEAPGAEQVRRSVPGLTLVRGVRFEKKFLVRWCARRFKRVDKLTDAFKPVYRRRDMLGARLYHALASANVAQIKLDDTLIESIALLRDEETGATRVSVRSKRGRKATT